MMNMKEELKEEKERKKMNVRERGRKERKGL